MNKLAQICDFKPGGTTVTAFVVLQRPGGIHYVFGSNQRRTFELNTVRTYIGDILQMLADAPRGEDGTERNRFVKELLRNILCYNLARITRYRNGLLGALEPCISICRNEGSRACKLSQAHRFIVPGS